ncbi:hypothetical protein [Rubinisphaera sp. JC750]|uniref:hypothetical protein n=1 Tax=Rubinisphaera sp. JC750 TaxID=2898658 RepID=UPI001F386B86|nr:hypothetical protein [Rubinisphaera sp. JC750]
MQHLKFGDRVTVVPVVHGSGDFAVEIRRLMLSEDFDCLAVPLPEQFQAQVEQAITQLPQVAAVWQAEQPRWAPDQWTPDQDEEDEEPSIRNATYVPIDPCQPVIAALRIALQEHMPRRFIDADVERFLPIATTLPDPYAVKKLQSGHFAAATIPVLGELKHPQIQLRAQVMAKRLRELAQSHQKVLALCSYAEWLPLKRAWNAETVLNEEPAGSSEPVESAEVAASSLTFLLGELPYVTGLYEQARYDLDDDENLSVDGIKQLLLRCREAYREEYQRQARPITPKLLSTYFRYVRNLALTERRLTPDLYTLIIAAQQIFGDQFAITLAEQAREYPFASMGETRNQLSMGIDRGRLPGGEVVRFKSRLPGHPVMWRTCQLQTRPPKVDQQKWKTRWNPYTQCSWPPEDNAIERFRSHVKDHALQLLGNDLARIEKFSTSLKDGLDIRETLRNWHTGDLYVREMPPVRGGLDCVLMLFDSPADPRDYPWRITWHAEHEDESTLSFFATDFSQEMVGPGIAQGQYGGAMFLFPPRSIPDIWENPRFDFVDTMEERLLVAACHYSKEKHIAVLSDRPPGIAWKKLAQRKSKKLIHVPMKRFSQQTIQQLRMFHVLNGQEVRSYAAHFIRKS